MTIFGGPGDDTLTATQDGDHVAGGTGNDTISGQDGVDHIYGDSVFNVDLHLVARDLVEPGGIIDPTEVEQMFEVLTDGMDPSRCTTFGSE